MAWLSRRTESVRARKLRRQADHILTIYDGSGEIDGFVSAVELYSQARRSLSPGHPDHDEFFAAYFKAVHAWAKAVGDVDSLRALADALRELADMLPPDDPDLGEVRWESASWSEQLFNQTNEPAAAKEALSHFEAARRLLPEHRGTLSRNCGLMLRRLFQREGDLDALTRAITYFRDAVAETSQEDPDRPEYLCQLGISLRTLYIGTGNIDALRESAAVLESGLDLTPPGHPSRGALLDQLGVTVRVVAERTGQGYTEAVRLAREALALDPREPAFLSNLGLALRHLYEQTADLDTLIEAEELSRRAGRTIPERSMELSNLGNVLNLRFDRTGDPGTLGEAISAFRESLELTPGDDPERATRQQNLAISLLSLFENTEDPASVREAIPLSRSALGLLPPQHPGRLILTNNLANGFQLLYKRTGDLAALAQAVEGFRDVVANVPSDHPDRAMYLNNLGYLLQQVFSRTGDTSVLTEAVQAGRDAVGSTPDGHRLHAVNLNNLGNSLHLLYTRTNDSAVLAEAATAFRNALAVLPRDHPDRPLYLGNLCTSLTDLGEHDEAVRTGRQAVALAPPGHPNRAGYLNNLGRALRDMGRQDEAAAVYRQAVHATPPGDIFRASQLMNLAGCLTDLSERRILLAEAATLSSATVVERLNANHELGRTAYQAGDAEGALAAYERAVALLPQAVSRGLSRTDREHRLGEHTGLAAEAASAALQTGRPDRAVELLEQARGLLLAQTLDTRGDLSDLRRLAPALADEFRRVREALDANHETPAQRRQAADQWDDLLTRVRRIPELKDFLRVQPITELRRHAEEGPVVMVNVSRHRADALIISHDHPVHVVRLPDVTRQTATDQVHRFYTSLVAADSRSLRERREGHRTMLDVLAWLWDEIAEPVLGELGLTASPQPGRPWPRLWWCPVGEMAYLPFHAAGRPHTRGTVLDRVISSYTPTLRALGHARRGPADAPGGALVVAMPVTEGAPPLDTRQETEQITTLLPGSEVLIGEQATHDTVLDALSRHRIAHLACHGLSDWHAPADSRLLLADHRDNPLTVSAISRLHLPMADLAYLSACSTASPNQRIADEAAHITTAFQLAGYRHVIGTLWPVKDAGAARIVGVFYGHITDRGARPPRTATSAQALHEAIHRLRDEFPKVPALWAAHIHVGI